MQWAGDTTWVNVMTGIFAILILVIAYFRFFRKKK
jgi:hypothetical protein